MAYRAMGGYGGMVLRRGSRSSVRAGDLDIGESLGVDTSDLTFPDMGFPDLGGGGGGAIVDAAGSDLGSSIWSDVGGFLGSAVNLAPGILGAANKYLGAISGGSSAAAGKASTSSPSTKAAIKRALKAGVRGMGHGRRMNPGNFKALRRSMRRLTAFEHAARRVYKFTHPARHKSHFKFHRRKRR